MPVASQGGAQRKNAFRRSFRLQVCKRGPNVRKFRLHTRREIATMRIPLLSESNEILCVLVARSINFSNCLQQLETELAHGFQHQIPGLGRGSFLYAQEAVLRE